MPTTPRCAEPWIHPFAAEFSRSLWHHEWVDITMQKSPSRGMSAAIPAGRSIPMDGIRPAVFLDRDGTLIEDVPYLGDPAQVRLWPGSADAVQRLRHAGFA